MSMLGPLAKGLAFLMGKQPEEQRQPRGFLGLEWSEQVTSGQKHGFGSRGYSRVYRRLRVEYELEIRSCRSASNELRASRMREEPCRRFILVTWYVWLFAVARARVPVN